MATWVALFAAGLILVLVVAGVVIALSRRSHVRSWRFGVFYESEERSDQD